MLWSQHTWRHARVCGRHGNERDEESRRAQRDKEGGAALRLACTSSPRSACEGQNKAPEVGFLLLLPGFRLQVPVRFWH